MLLTLLIGAVLPLACHCQITGQISDVKLDNNDPVVQFAFGKIMEYNARHGRVDGMGWMLEHATKQVS